MARRTPQAELQPPTLERKRRPDIITEVRHYEIITPLFGGGAEAGINDPVTPVRGSSIRGHLRFWWRAMCGGQRDWMGDDTSAQLLRLMKQREDEIWGAASDDKKVNIAQVPKVELSVVWMSTPNPADSKSPFHVEKKINPHTGRPELKENGEPKRMMVSHDEVAPAYAAFPLQPPVEAWRDGLESETVTSKIKFKLKISYHSTHRDEVEAALWAWETFGGIGARTRRGFGALRLSVIETIDADGKIQKRNIEPPSITDVESGIKERLGKIDGTFHQSVPHLPRSPLHFKITQPSNDAHTAWSNLIEKYRAFRQHRTRPMGRSLWPEPDAIRHLTGRNTHPTHGTRLTTDNCFPRAEFGLPIIFHFKKDDVRQGDPHDTTLQGRDKKRSRLASPLILRPLICTRGNETCAVGLAIVLDAPRTPPGGLVLKETARPVSSTLPPGAGTRITPLNGHADIYAALFQKL